MSARDNIGKVGRIVGGRHSDWNIKIVDDSENTGGYLVLYWSSSSSEGFDDWVDSPSALESYFSEFEGQVEWNAALQ